MNLINDLCLARRVVRYCEAGAVRQRARMNFIVNLVTILELFSRSKFRNHFDVHVNEDSFPLSMILHVVSSEREKEVITRLIQLRNEIVHEGTAIGLTKNDINLFYTIIKSIIIKSDGKDN